MKHMSRLLPTIVAIALLVAGCGSSGSSPSSSASSTTASTASALVDIGSGIKGPSGLTATVYATGLTHAAAFAFDAEQRLWVATADYTDAGKDGVYLVTKSGATPIEVITALHTPLGLLWHDGTLYVASKERIDAYSGLTGTTFTTHRTVVTLPTGVGEVNNIVLAPDGRLLVGVSAPCDHCTPTSKYSGAILAVRTDGTALRVYASGIRAPVGLAYYPNTSDLFVSMDYRDDLGTSTPGDALAVVREGTAWKNPECYGQGGSACTGVTATTAGLDKHAAVSDVAIVTGQLGSTIGNSAIVAEWALGKVQRVALTKTGTTYTGSVSTLLTGIKNPVAVILASDKSLLVGDWTTGIVYRVAATSAGST
jgi:glucose/arabinose dehydrogenase